jgi:putative flavoprotein involved in K+ transport
MYDADHGNPPVVIIGAGPAGLAVAASLHRRNIQSIILVEQKHPDSFGSWENRLTGLEVTTQKRWCHLPRFLMSDDLFSGENVGAQDYRRYLKLYSARFGRIMNRGVRVENITRGGVTSPWMVKCGEGTKVEASAVVVATGKHRVPQRSPSDDLCAKLTTAEIPFVHCSDLRNSQTWAKATDAANAGKLRVVGFGNVLRS